MQQRLIIPNLRIKVIPLERQHHLRQLPILIRPNLDRRPKRNKELQKQKQQQNTAQKQPSAARH
jgi:hypothetical protein